MQPRLHTQSNACNVVGILAACFERTSKWQATSGPSPVSCFTLDTASPSPLYPDKPRLDLPRPRRPRMDGPTHQTSLHLHVALTPPVRACVRLQNTVSSPPPPPLRQMVHRNDSLETCMRQSLRHVWQTHAPGILVMCFPTSQER
jgi:hypothetical protein